MNDPNDGVSQPTTVILQVGPVNDAPLATPDSYSVDEDHGLLVAVAGGVLVNDSDAENTALTASLVSAAQHGQVTLQPDGSFEYTPSQNYFGEDTFTYQASDGLLSSGGTTVTITLNPVNDCPVALQEYVAVIKAGVVGQVHVNPGTTGRDAPLVTDKHLSARTAEVIRVCAVGTCRNQEADLKVGLDGAVTKWLLDQ